MGFFGPPDIDKLKEKKNIRSLIKSLRYKKDHKVRKNAALALKEIEWKPQSDIDLAYYLIAKRNWGRLRKLDKSAVLPLTNALHYKDHRDKEKAAEILGNIGDERAVEGLAYVLYHDKNYDVRLEAVRALGKIGKHAIEHLVNVLRDPNLDVRNISRAALIEMEDERAKKAIIEELRTECMICERGLILDTNKLTETTGFKDFKSSLGPVMRGGDLEKALDRMAERVAYKCRNCGAMVCYRCSQNEKCRICGGNVFDFAADQTESL
jgi:hypothetical protein